ncbi:TetR/AcrR family transcriptional regulator [Aeromicrobium halocynthiae]|uniref:TetR/AcrR family transcriptional regulator n=1 Tax=Aeromicrobium halocynthiae TaxID=560557 RepID=A0ABN2VW78_9ACTN
MPEHERPRLASERRVEDFWSDRAHGAAGRILTGATLAFADLGYHGASTREIAARSGMSPAAVYIHFESKEDLFLRIATEGHRASTAAFIDPAGLATDPSTKLRLAITSFAAWNADMHILSRMIEYEMRLHGGERFSDVARLRRGVEQFLRSLLEEGVSTGAFDVPDPEGMKILILSFCIDVARWYHHDFRRSPTAIGVQYADLALSLVLKH